MHHINVSSQRPTKGVAFPGLIPLFMVLFAQRTTKSGVFPGFPIKSGNFCTLYFLYLLSCSLLWPPRHFHNDYLTVVALATQWTQLTVAHPTHRELSHHDGAEL